MLQQQFTQLYGMSIASIQVETVCVTIANHLTLLDVYCRYFGKRWLCYNNNSFHSTECLSQVVLKKLSMLQQQFTSFYWMSITNVLKKNVRVYNSNSLHSTEWLLQIFRKKLSVPQQFTSVYWMSIAIFGRNRPCCNYITAIVIFQIWRNFRHSRLPHGRAQ